MAMIAFGSDVTTDLEAASSREWLETNGLGGFASGTISGANTRRYHGLLTAATSVPLGRTTMLSKFEETLIVNGRRTELSTNRYSGTVYPEGYRLMTSFTLDPFPVWTFKVGGLELEKKIFMPHGVNAVVCRWRIKGRSTRGAQIGLELRPLLSFVDYHSLQHANDGFDAGLEAGEGWVTVRPRTAMPELVFTHNATAVDATGHWYHGFEYAIEKERGFDYREDLFQPFVLSFDLTGGGADVVASLEHIHASEAAKLEKSEKRRRAQLVKAAAHTGEFASSLALAADQFIVKRGSGETVLAGYPWFTDWGRDTMISLAGLTLSTNRPEIARGILLEFARHISMGMLPNRFPDAGGEAEYNTVDASLWYFEAIRAYAAATGDHTLVRERLYPHLVDILLWHVKGTRYGIGVDTDGLLRAGEPGVQLTWMDAKVGDLVITPRIGKPVEIQALWYNALRIMEDFAELFGDRADSEQYAKMAELARESFNALFWNEQEQCLFDVIEDTGPDASIRPNQIFAASLGHSMLDAERAAAVVTKVEAELLTPVGLRSLAPGDARYVGTYIGSPFERDSAYHQGTVWGWLIGAFVDAYRRVYANEADLEDRNARLLFGFEQHLSEAGLGQVSEIFDGDPPHTPRGCPAQAWSVAEVLRVLR